MFALATRLSTLVRDFARNPRSNTLAQGGRDDFLLTNRAPVDPTADRASRDLERAPMPSTVSRNDNNLYNKRARDYKFTKRP